MALVIFDNLRVRQLGLRRDHLLGKQDLLPGLQGLGVRDVWKHEVVLLVFLHHSVDGLAVWGHA